MFDFWSDKMRGAKESYTLLDKGKNSLIFSHFFTVRKYV